MDISKKRRIDRESAYQLYSVGAFMVFLWAFINIFYEMPSLLLRLTLPEIIGASAYYLAFALLESGLYFGVLLLILVPLVYLLPRRWFSDHFISLAGLLAVGLAIAAMLLQVGPTWLMAASWRRLLFYAGLVGLALVAYTYAIFRFPRFETLVSLLFKRLSSLAVLYTFFGIAGVVIVIFRNIF